MFKSAVLAGFLLLLFVAAFAVYAFSKVNAARTSVSHPVSFTIAPGENIKSVAGRLQEQGVISSPFVFRTYLAVTGLAEKIQAGTFPLDGKMSPREIADVLAMGRGEAQTIRVRLGEGWNNREYAEALAESGLFSQEEFLSAVKNFSAVSDYDFFADKPAGKDLQGFLFPDTYDFRADSSAESAIAKMLGNFSRKLAADHRENIRQQGKAVFDVVTMASLVEGEVGRNLPSGQALTSADRESIARERKLVAGVFYNRLRAKYPLQSDATVSYVTGQKKARSSIAETQIDDPYNTYRYIGLPPGPINNPSLDSILAAIEPENTDYFYFLSDPSGKMYFAKTLAEHNKNRELYLE